MKKIILILTLLITSIIVKGQTATAPNQTLILNATKSNSVIGGIADKIIVTPTISTSAYSIGDNVGGIMTFTNSVRSTTSTGVLIGFDIWDKDNQKPQLTIDVWDASPSGTFTDNAAEVIAGDHVKHLGSFSIVTADWVTTGAVARASIRYIGLLLKGNSSRNIYITIITNSAATYTSTSGLVTKANILQD